MNSSQYNKIMAHLEKATIHHFKALEILQFITLTKPVKKVKKSKKK